MAWPNPFLRKNESTRSAWGYTFQLSSRYPELFCPYLYRYLSRKTCSRSNLLLRHVSRLIFRPKGAILTPKSSSHLTIEQMKPMKHSYDRLGEQALDRLNQLSPPPRAALPRNSVRHSSKNAAAATQQPPMPQRDLYILLRDNAYNDEILGQLWSEVNTVPSWVCWEQIARGQDCFYRYGGPALTGLAFQSLLGGMVWSPGP